MANRWLVALLPALTLAACDGGSPTVAPPPAPVSTGQLVVQIAGAPLNAAIPDQAARLLDAGFGLRVRGPGGLDTLLLASTTLRSLPAGLYSFTAGATTVDSVRYAATAAPQTTTLGEGATQVVTATYAATTGGLDLRVVGAAIDTVRIPAVLRRPDGTEDSISLPTRVALLPPGQYVIVSGAVTIDGLRLVPSNAADTVTVSAGPIAAPTSLAFVERRAALRLAIEGIADASDRLGFVTLEGEDGSQRTLQATADTLVFANLRAGTFVVRAQPFSVATARYEPEREADTIVVRAGADEIVPLVYRRETASITIALLGVPAGTAPSVLITGPGGYSRTISESAVLGHLVPGAYTVVADPISTDAHTYRADVPTAVVTASFGSAELQEIRYLLATGALSIRIVGLPDSVAPSVTVSAPALDSVPGFPWQLTGPELRSNDHGQRARRGTAAVHANSRAAHAHRAPVAHPDRCRHHLRGVHGAHPRLRDRWRLHHAGKPALRRQCAARGLPRRAAPRLRSRQ
jgi:hypothetical protein